MTARSGIGRATSRPDVGRLREALSGPGADPRRWVVYATVNGAPEVLSDGVWLDCTIVETGEPLRVRWGLLLLPGGRGGIWLPPPKDGDEIAVQLASGDPLSAVGTFVFASADVAVPEAVTSEPDAVHIYGAGSRILLDTSTSILATAGEAATVKAPLVNLGDEGLSAETGVVQGEAVDPYTGATYAALGNVSTVVRAKR